MSTSMSRGRPVSVTVAAALLAGLVFAAGSVAVGMGPFAPDPAKEPVEPPFERVTAAETMEVSPPLDLDARIDVQQLSASEELALSAVPGGARVVARSPSDYPVEDAGLGFGELRVVLESGDLASLSWQRWDSSWDFEDLASANPAAQRVEREDGSVVLVLDGRTARRSVLVWTGDVMVTINVRSTDHGSAPVTGLEEIEKWTIGLATRLSDGGL